MFDCLWPHGYTVHGILQALLEWLVFPFSRGSSQPTDQTQVTSISDWFFTNWATREDQDTGVGSLFLLQQIFLMQELNRGLLHCRWILYQLSYQRIAKYLVSSFFFLFFFLCRVFWCWERLKVGGKGDNRGWDAWMASLTEWIWVWVNSVSWWWTGRPGVL